jgi:hypothetical protein
MSSQKITTEVLLEVKENIGLWAYSVFIELKDLYKHGSIHNYRERYSWMASQIGRSESCLRRYLKILFKAGVIWADERGTLRFMSNLKASELLSGIKCKWSNHEGAPYLRRRARVYAFGDITKTRDLLFLCCIDNNIRRQVKAKRHKVKGRAHEEALKTTGSDRSKSYKYLRNYAVKQYDEAGIIPRKGDNIDTINPVTTLSRHGIARVSGFRSPMTGTRIARRLSERGVLIDKRTKASVFKKNIPEKAFYQNRDMFPRNCFWKDGHVFRRKANNISVVSKTSKG